MTIFNIKNVSNDFEWPSEQLFIVQTNTDTSAEGSIHINYDGITQIDTTDIEIFKADRPIVPADQYTQTGADLFTGTELLFDYTACTKGSKVVFTLNSYPNRHPQSLYRWP